MNVWREVGRKYMVWLLMSSATAGCVILFVQPLGNMSRSEHLSFLLRALLAGSLLTLNLFYFSARLNEEKITRGIAACIFLALYFFPDYVWGTLGGVFGAFDPVISALLVLAAGFAALNVALVLTDWRDGRGRKPS